MFGLGVAEVVVIVIALPVLLAVVAIPVVVLVVVLRSQRPTRRTEMRVLRRHGAQIATTLCAEPIARWLQDIRTDHGPSRPA